MKEKRIKYEERYNKIQIIHPIYDRKLIRPEINWRKSFNCFLVVVLMDEMVVRGIFSYLMGYVEIRNIYDLKIYILLVFWCMACQGIICSRAIAIWCIRVYQRYASAKTRLMCCYIPSCSEYTILAIEKYGVFYGGYKALCRIVKCGSYGGIDYP